MVRRIFLISAVLTVLLILLISIIAPNVLYWFIIVIPLIILGISDLNSTHNLLRNYPIIGHMRYMLESIRPEIQQYFINTNQNGRPFNREVRNLIYQRGKQLNDTLPFGTQHNITEQGYELAAHSLAPKAFNHNAGRITIGGVECTKPYSASRLNISAMSFGALSPTAIKAMNAGAKLGNFAHNTGEGGLSDYHLAKGGDIIWQIGTGYFGCRTQDGHFHPQLFTDKATLEVVKMIEIKLSQGAKPSHGGILPAAKVTQEIASFRCVDPGEDCISPPAHSAFDTPEGLLQFVQKLRGLCGGKPVGFKLCIGIKSEFMSICKAMLKTGITPDFITIDGAEGGTGAAPLEFSNRLGVPVNEALAFVNNCLIGCNLRDKIKLIASGKVATEFDMLTKLSLGADACNAARAMMFAVGCIQALRCNQNTCPTGVTSQDPNRFQAIVPDHKAKHVANFHNATVDAMLDMVAAMGLESPDALTPNHILRRNSNAAAVPLGEAYPSLQLGELLGNTINIAFKADWDHSRAERF